MMLDGAQRAGLLTRAGFLTVTGAADGSHPVKRGRRVYERFLCGELPPPPADVPPAKPASAGRHHPPALRGARPEPLHRRLPHADGPHRVRVRALRRHRQVPDHGQRRRWSIPSASIVLDGSDRKFNDARELSQVPGQEPGGGPLLRHPVDALRLQARRDARPTGPRWKRSPRPSPRATRSPTCWSALAGSRTFRYRTPDAGEKLP